MFVIARKVGLIEAVSEPAAMLITGAVFGVPVIATFVVVC